MVGLRGHGFDTRDDPHLLRLFQLFGHRLVQRYPRRRAADQPATSRRQRETSPVDRARIDRAGTRGLCRHQTSPDLLDRAHDVPSSTTSAALEVPEQAHGSRPAGPSADQKTRMRPIGQSPSHPQGKWPAWNQKSCSRKYVHSASGEAMISASSIETNS